MNVEKMPKLIIFDWDGTIIDSANHVVKCAQLAAVKFNLPVPDAGIVRKAMGLSLSAVIQKTFPELGPVEQTGLIEAFREAYLTLEQGIVPVYESVEEVLQYFKRQDILLAVATGKGRFGLNHDLRLNKLDVYFSATRCGDETFSKPHPAMVLELLEELDVHPNDAIVVGDSSHDILMAKNAHVRSIGVSYGTHTQEELAYYQPDAIISSITELMTLFKIKTELSQQ